MQNIYGLKVKDGLDIYETYYSEGGYFDFDVSECTASELNNRLQDNWVDANSLIFVKTGVKSEEKAGTVVNTPIYQRALIFKANDTANGTYFVFGYLDEDGLPVIYKNSYPEQSEEKSKDFKVYTPRLQAE